MSFLLGILFLIVGLIISIALHEVGHMLPAKKFNTLVPEYMIGFGKTIWSKKKGETTYGIKALLLGGYCRISGMYGPPRKGAVVYRDGHRKIRTDEAEQLSPAQIEQLTPTLAQAARESSLAELPVGQEHRAFYLLPVWKKLVVMFGGPVMNLFLCIVFLAIAMCGIGIYQPSTTVAGPACYSGSRSELCSQQKDWAPSPAAQAGLKAGDKILSWNGIEVDSWDEIRAQASATKADAQVTVERDGKQQTLTLKNVEGRAGIISQVQRQHASVATLAETTWQIGYGTAAVVVRLPMAVWDATKAMVGIAQRDQSGVMSIVGAGRVAGEISSTSSTEADLASRVAALLSLMASLNMALFVFNLIPLPPLDGGHIAGALFQGIRSRWAKLRHKPWPGPIDAARAVPITYAVAALLIGMTVILVAADIVAPISIS